MPKLAFRFYEMDPLSLVVVKNVPEVKPDWNSQAKCRGKVKKGQVNIAQDLSQLLKRAARHNVQFILQSSNFFQKQFSRPSAAQQLPNFSFLQRAFI